MSKSQIKNVEFSLGSKTLLVTVEDDNGHFVDSKLFEIAHKGSKAVIVEVLNREKYPHTFQKRMLLFIKLLKKLWMQKYNQQTPK